MSLEPLAVNGSEQPLTLRRRPELTVREQWYRGRRHWLVKDPVTLQYFHLLDEEYAVLGMLDDPISPAEIQRRFAAQFAPRQLGVAQLQGFLGDLHRCGLLLADAAGQGDRLRERRTLRRRGAWLQVAGNLLAVRLPGVDPDPLLRRLAPLGRRLFSRAALVVWLLVVAAAAVLVAVRCDRLVARLPEFREFFSAGNALPLLVTLAAVKVLHELGHAVACRRFGGECHELGVMLLLFTPCLYCDVTDAWLLPSKWQRIAISAAGVYVELFLAAVCAFGWWFSEPGLLNSLCLNTLFVGSVSTLVFNGNPLLRFDGYYVLADLIEVPNLQTRSQAVLSRFLMRVGLGVDLPDERAFTERHRGWLAGYALAAIGYRGLVVAAMLFFLSEILRPYHLELVAQAFIAIAVLGMVLVPLGRLGQLFSNPVMKQRIQRRRVVLVGSVLGGSLAALLLTPWPCHVGAPVHLEPLDARYVYVPAAGMRGDTVRAGTVVAAGATLARLEDPELALRLVQLASERTQQEWQVRHLEARRGADAEAAARLPTARQLLAEFDERLRELRQREELLRLTAPVAGTVIAPPRVPAHEPASVRLGGWSGTPLDEANRGCRLAAGTLFCLVGQPHRLQAVALIDQADVEFVQAGQRVRVRLNQWPGRTLRGTVQAVAKLELAAEPRTLAAAGALPAHTDRSGVPRPLTTAYQARVALDQPDDKAVAGAPGRCRIAVAPRSLVQRLLRYLSRTFRFVV